VGQVAKTVVNKKASATFARPQAAAGRSLGKKNVHAKLSGVEPGKRCRAGKNRNIDAAERPDPHKRD